MPVQTSYSDTYKVGFAGMLADSGGGAHDIMSMVNVDVVSIPFGTGVIFKSSNVTDMDALQPLGSSDKVAGIVVFSDAYQRTYTLGDGTLGGDLDSVGLVVGTIMNVLRKGRIWVTPVTACAPGDRGYLSYNATGVATAVGLWENAADSGHTIDMSAQTVFVTTALAGGLAILDCNFTNQ